MKQPHEDVPRPYGDDPLLSLDESAIPFRNALAVMAAHLQTATFVGNPAPIVERMFNRVFGPKPGDMVMEQSSHFPSRDQETRNKGLGRLVLRREEWWHTDEEWQQMLTDGAVDADEERWKDTAWYVQYGPDHICRWTNCAFVVVPVDISVRKWDEE